MTGILLGLAMTISSTGVSPALETPRAAVAPAIFTSFDLPVDVAATPAPAWRGQPVKRAKAGSPRHTSAKKFSITERIIAVAAGLTVGWVVGGGIGGKLTESDNPYDDTSAVKGIMLGAPIGGAAGALLAWRLTDR